MLFGPGSVGRQMVAGNAAGNIIAGASLNLNFMNAGLLPSGVVFTRNSTATYFDSTGTMQTAAMNIALQSADLSNAAWAKGGITVAAPVVTGNNTAAPDGTTTASRVVYPAVPTGTNVSVVTQTLTVTAAVYTFSIWLKGSVGGEVIYLHATPDAITYYRQQCVLTTQWQRFTLTTGTLTAAGWFFGVGNDGRAAGPSTSAQTIYAWGGQVELGSTATTYAPTTTTPNGAPRWDYDPTTHALNGLLIEEARTNVSFPSTNWSANAPPSGSVDGVTQNIGISPSGAHDAMAFIPGAFSNVHQYFTSFGGTNSTTYTYSVYVKAAGMNFVAVGLENSAFPPQETATFNLANGTVDRQNPAATAVIQAVGNGWYRCSVTATSASSGTNGYIPNIKPSAVGGFVNVSVGDGINGIWAWGNQVEAGAFPTSHIPTTAASVTRAGDACSVPVGAWYSTTQGSMQIEYMLEGSQDSYGVPIALVGANINTDYIYTDQNIASGIAPNVSINAAAISVAGTQVSLALWASNQLVPVGSITKAAASWSTTVGITGAHNGVLSAGTGVAPGTLPVITNLSIAGQVHYQPPFNLWARHAGYWPRVLSNTELQTVTR